ncbi:PTS sugar transporter subunit IIC [Clostridium beijerinckii]|uniref:Permease IIC component n=1 Tax=Clostridium beijerinckii TaxID=1520 RepID=A0A1S8SD94_CLOBE|nr:PTS transporter subunit EIIC [Clostridium beijerinckii]NRY61708.1 PTS system cellobiose-specific IIC component [Clostridium beijerinckii]OOM63319.1 lichenan permease IIC component [Clostridium beijerinckii]
MSNFDAKAISKKISPILNKIQKSKLANGVSGGMMVAMPVTLFGAFAALFLNLQIPAWKGFIAATGIAYALNVAIRFSTNFLAVVFGVTIASSYAKQYKEEGTVPALLALVCFFIVTPFTTDKAGTTLSMYWLGAPGIFSAIIISLISTRIYIYLKQKGITIKMPSTVPPVVSGSFSSLIPGFAAIVIFITVAALFAATPFKTMHQFIYNFVQTPLQGVGGNIVSIIILWTFAQVLWFFGIHGTLVIYSVMMPIFTAMDAAQLAAYSAGEALPNITGRAFVSTYTMSASAIGFALLMLFAAKSKQYKTLGKLTAVPSLFGISEPLVFGTPLVFNFKFVVPFVCMNAINLTIAYFLTVVGIVPRVAGMTPMSGMPIIFSGLMEGSWKIAVLQVVLVGLSTLVWYPFFRKADKEAYELEQNTENQ